MALPTEAFKALTGCRSAWIYLAAGVALVFFTWATLAHAQNKVRVPKPFAPKVNEALLAVQQDIVQADRPGAFYDKAYRPAESYYWRNLPGWMQEDAARRHVNRILDIGCGYGTLLAVATTIYGARGHCMDVRRYLHPSVASKWKLQFSEANIELDPIPFDGAFDVIIMTEVLEHFNFQPVPTLKKIRNALAPDGVFFLSTPDAKEWGKTQKYYKRLEDLPMPASGQAIVDDHVWQYSERELRQVLKQAGFSIVRWGYSPGSGYRHFNVVLKKK